jgi:hypothetical protein
MVFWMREVGIDGFRCDVAALVPIAFWERMRPVLNALAADRGGAYLLAEAHEPIHHRAAFDATYDWDLFDQLRSLAAGTVDVSVDPSGCAAPDASMVLRAWWDRRVAHYGPEDHRLNYTANHDSNSWQGSCQEFFGTPARLQAMAVLAATLPGIPLLYGGQEAFFQKRLAFFERDPIDWGQRALEAFYAALLQLKGKVAALANHWHGVNSGDATLPPGAHPVALEQRLLWLPTGNPALVAFVRLAPPASTTPQAPALLVWVNTSDQPQVWGAEVSDWAWAPALAQPWLASVPVWPQACGSESSGPEPHAMAPACGWACWAADPVLLPRSSDPS